MKKLPLLLFIICMSCGPAPEAPQWNANAEIEAPSSAVSHYQYLGHKALPVLKCIVEKNYQMLDQFEWFMPAKPALIKILKYRIKNTEHNFVVKIKKQSFDQGEIEILFRKVRHKDFRDNTLAQNKNFESAVLQEGVPTEIYTSDEIIHCTFNNS